MAASLAYVLLAMSARPAAAQAHFELHTRNTQLAVEVAAAAPCVVQLGEPGEPGQAKWLNRKCEALPDHVESGSDRIPLHWTLDSSASKSTNELISVVYESQSPHLRLTWNWSAKEAYGPIEHSITIENLDAKTIWLPFQDSFQFDFQVDPHTALKHFYVEKGADTPSNVGTHDVLLNAGYSWEGNSSTYSHPKDGEAREIIPWFLVQRDDRTQSGWYVGIEFSGRTRLTIARNGDSLRGAAGLNPEPSPFRTRLAPGEAFHTPTIFVGAFHDGPDGAGNVLRKWVREALTNPATWRNPNYPLLVNNSWGAGMAINEDLAKKMIRDAADLQMDMFHMDAGWFRGVGDWYPNLEKFPHGIVALADEAHRDGLKFGMWVDWTQAGLDTTPGALNARDPKAQDWLVSDLPPDWKPEPFKGQTIDIGVPAAKEWAEGELTRIINDNHLDMLEHDGYLVAQGCDRSDHPHAPPVPGETKITKEWGSYFVLGPNATDVSYHAVNAYYSIYAKLRREHPGLLFEVCDDGGRMVDFGSASHADYFSITDTYDPLSNRRAFYDTSFVLPPAMLEDYVEKWPAPTIANFRYMLRSGMMGWLTVMMDTTTWTAEQHAAAKEEFLIYKNQLRPLIRDAELFHVSSRPDGKHWDGMEYFDPQSGRGVLYAFHSSMPDEASHAFQLEGLRKDRRYALHFEDHSSPDRIMPGSELFEKGLTVKLNDPNTSELVFLREVSRTPGKTSMDRARPRSAGLQ